MDVVLEPSELISIADLLRAVELDTGLNFKDIDHILICDTEISIHFKNGKKLESLQDVIGKMAKLAKEKRGAH